MLRSWPVVLAVVVSGCGWSVSAAREAAAQRTCEFYARCDAIGANRTYATVDECLVTWRSTWQSTWPTDGCQSIDGSAMEVCLSAISATECNNLIDFLATATKCERVDVCQ